MEELWIKALSGVVDVLQKWLDQAPAYVSDLVNRYGSYYSWTSLSSAVWALLVIILCLYFIKFWKRIFNEDESTWVWIIWLSWVVLAIAIVVFFVELSDIFKWIYLPEVALINEFTPHCSCWH